jgi:hypothetical protein
MNDERYAPPLAVAVDEPVDPRVRPASVTWAVRFLWLSFAIGLPERFYHLFFPVVDLPLLTHLFRWSFGMTIAFAIAFALYAPGSIGWNWARWIIAALNLLYLVLLSAIFDIVPAHMGAGGLARTQYATQWLVHLVGVILLFTPRANAWYRAVKAARAGAG